MVFQSSLTVDVRVSFFQTFSCYVLLCCRSPFLADLQDPVKKKTLHPILTLLSTLSLHVRLNIIFRADAANLTKVSMKQLLPNPFERCTRCANSQCRPMAEPVYGGLALGHERPLGPAPLNQTNTKPELPEHDNTKHTSQPLHSWRWIAFAALPPLKRASRDLSMYPHVVLLLACT